MLVLVILGIALTNNANKDEKSKLGKIISNSEGAKIYINKGKVSFKLPADSVRYFADTKNKYVAEYFAIAGCEFGTELFGDSCELEVYVNSDNYADLDFEEKDVLDKVAQRCVEIASISLDGDIVKNRDITDNQGKKVRGPKYRNVMYAQDIESRKEYNFVSHYFFVDDGNLIEVKAITYGDTPVDVENDGKTINATYQDIIKSFSFGVEDNTAEKANDGFFSKLKQFNFSLWIFMVPLLFILCSNMTVAKNYGEWHEDSMDLSHSKEILGFMAVFIVIHHLVQHIGAQNAGVIGFLENFGVCFVGMFFFYSGYGLVVSYKSKNNYLKGFLKKRLPSVLVPFYVCIIIFIIYDIVLEKKSVGINTLWQLVGWVLINDHMWYIVEIVILYVIFRIVFGLIKNEKVAFAIMGVLTLAMICISLLLGHGDKWFQGEWWYNSTAIFYIGMLIGANKNKFSAFVKKYFKILVPILLVGFLTLFKCTEYMLEKHGYWSEYNEISLSQSIADKFMTLGVQLPMIMLFVFFVIVLGFKIKCDNAVLRYFGKISLELYLIHNLFIRAYKGISGAGIFWTLVLISSLISATLIHYLVEFILSIIYKRPRPKYQRKLPYILNAVKKILNSRRKSLKNNPRKAIRIKFREIICILLSALTVFPLYILAVNATKGKMITNFSLIPEKHFLENITAMNAEFVSAGGGLYLGIFNSCIVATFSALLATYLGAMTAYAFERYNFKFKKGLWIAVIGCMMIPTSAGFVGLYKMLAKMGLMNKFLPVILMAAATPSAAYFIRMYLKNISIIEICEAARIDGAKEFSIFNFIILPLMWPVLALQLTFSFVAAWNNGYAQTLLLYDWKKKTIACYLDFSTAGAASDPIIYAVMLAATLAPIVVYILCSKSIISSITLGAVKE